jgi:phage terminase Nu1 subunit (DNA packaging protein)
MASGLVVSMKRQRPWRQSRKNQHCSEWLCGGNEKRTAGMRSGGSSEGTKSAPRPLTKKKQRRGGFP